MKQIKVQPRTLLNYVLLSIFCCFLFDFIPDGQLDLSRQILVVILNSLNYYNFLYFYTILSSFKFILLYVLLFSPRFISIILFINFCLIVSKLILLVSRSYYTNVIAHYFFCILVSHQKLNQNISKAFENIP